MSTRVKLILVALVVLIIAFVAAYFYWKKNNPQIITVTEPAPGDTGGNTTNQRRGVTIPGTNTNTGSITSRWKVVGMPDQQGYCKMGQAKIWDGTKWVCCVSEKTA